MHSTEAQRRIGRDKSGTPDEETAQNYGGGVDTTFSITKNELSRQFTQSLPRRTIVGASMNAASVAAGLIGHTHQPFLP